MKKSLFILTLCISLLLGGLMSGKAVKAAELDAPRIITPMFTNVNAFNTGFEILDNGEAHCMAYLSFRNADSALLIIYLEKYINGNWVVWKSWSTTALQRDIIAYLYGVEPVPKGAQYRMRAFGYVFVGSSIVESVNTTYDPIYY